MSRLTAVLLLCVSGCAPSIAADRAGEIAQIRDPEIRADLDRISVKPSSPESAETRLAQCMIAVATYAPPSQPTLATVLAHYQAHAGESTSCVVGNWDEFQVGCTVERHGGNWSSVSEASCTPECLLEPGDDGALAISVYSTPCGDYCENAAVAASRSRRRCSRWSTSTARAARESARSRSP